MFKLSKKSIAQYETLHPDLRIIIDEVLKCSSIDFTISEGYRSVEKQFEYYQKGRKKVNNEWIVEDRSKVVTYLDGYTSKSKHNVNPAMAFDFYIYVPGKPELKYDIYHIIAVGHLFAAMGQKLYNEGKISHQVRWGGDFNQDGEIMEPDVFSDTPHIELI